MLYVIAATGWTTTNNCQGNVETSCMQLSWSGRGSGGATAVTVCR